MQGGGYPTAQTTTAPFQADPKYLGQLMMNPADPKTYLGGLADPGVSGGNHMETKFSNHLNSLEHESKYHSATENKYHNAAENKYHGGSDQKYQEAKYQEAQEKQQQYLGQLSAATGTMMCR